MRVWYLARTGISLTDSTKSVIVDRVMGFIGVMCMVLATAPMMLEAMGASALRIGYLTLMAAGIAAIVGFWLAGLIPSISHRGRLLGKLAEFVSMSRHLARHPQLALRILGWAIIANLCNTIGIWLISTAYGYEISFYVALVTSSTIFWVALMPISFSGWGLRLHLTRELAEP